MRYAQIDSNAICIGVSDLSGPVDAPHMIAIGAQEFPLGRKRVGNAWQDVTPEPVDPSYRSIDKVEAMGLIRTVTGMTPTQEMAFRDDENLALFWRIWREDVGNVIHRDHPLTDQILNGIQAAGYLTAPQRQAVLDNWPVA